MSNYPGYKIDVVFCIDVTASMSPCINELKAKAISFYNDLKNKMEADSKAISSMRAKIITFNDFGEEPNAIKVGDFFAFPEQQEGFNSFVNALTVHGGGDDPENALEALAMAMKTDWTQFSYDENDKGRHIIVMLTDAPFLPLDARAGCVGYPEGMPEDDIRLFELWDGGRQADGITISPKGRRLNIFAPNDNWAELIQGNAPMCCTFTQVDGAKGLKEISWDEIIASIVASV